MKSMQQTAPSPQYVARKVIESWIPLIVAGIIIYIVYFLVVHVFKLVPSWASEYEYFVKLAIVLVIGSILIYRTGREVNEALYPHDPHTATALKFILQFLIALAVIVIVIVSVVTLTPTAAALSGTIIGVILGLAFQQTLNDIISGLVLLLSKPFRPGERITFLTWRYGMIRAMYPTEGIPNGFTGTIVDMGLMFTTIMLDTGELAKIPNSVLKDSMIISHSNVKHRLVRVRLDLPTKIRIVDFEKALREALLNDGITDVRVYAEETWQQVEMYQVAIVAIVDSNMSRDELRNLILRRAIEVRGRFLGQPVGSTQ